MDNIVFKLEGENAPRIVSTKDIAFYPNEGFMIFEGYLIPNEITLPFSLKIYQAHSQLKICKYFELEIRKIWWKDLQSKPSESDKKCTCDPNSEDDCECFITFFPSEIIILEFMVLEESFDPKYGDILKSIDWDYCIDNRFKSPSELLITYKGLLNLPNNRYEPYRSCIQDKEFYRGYYEMKRNPVNKYQLQGRELKEIKELIQEKDKEWNANKKNNKKIEVDEDMLRENDLIARILRDIDYRD